MYTGTAKESKNGIDSIKKQMEDIRTQISSLNTYIESNRYDRETVRDAEEDIAQLESKLRELEQRFEPKQPSITPVTQTVPLMINGNGRSFSQQMLVFAFSHMPERADIDRRINSLKQEYIMLESREYALEDKMFACEINMSSNYRTKDVVSQSIADLDFYNEEYAAVHKKMKEIESEIKLLKEQRKQLFR